MSKSINNLATADKIFFGKGGLNPGRTGKLVDDALKGCDDGELFLEYVQSESLAFDDGKLKSASYDTTRGFGLRAALGCSDRGHTAISQLRPGDIDWQTVFGKPGARWFHTGGIFAALSESTPLVAQEAMAAAKNNGAMVSYDLNYRPSLWQAIGGQAKAQEVNRMLAPFVDVMLGNEEDFTTGLGFEVEGLDENLSKLDVSNFQRMIERAVREYTNFKVVATTLRNAKTATSNDWGAICYADGRFYQAPLRENLEIFDRVGGGDSFASGLIYGFLTGQGAQYAVECGAAHGALAMTTPGDTTMATLAEVERVMKGGAARVSR